MASTLVATSAWAYLGSSLVRGTPLHKWARAPDRWELHQGSQCCRAWARLHHAAGRPTDGRVREPHPSGMHSAVLPAQLHRRPSPVLQPRGLRCLELEVGGGALLLACRGHSRWAAGQGGLACPCTVGGSPACSPQLNACSTTQPRWCVVTQQLRSRLQPLDNRISSTLPVQAARGNRHTGAHPRATAPGPPPWPFNQHVSSTAQHGPHSNTSNKLLTRARQLLGLLHRRLEANHVHVQPRLLGHQLQEHRQGGNNTSGESEGTGGAGGQPAHM